MKSLNSFSPDWISPPGATIQRLLVKTGRSRQALANALDVSDEILDKIISGKAVITKDIARRLGSFFGSSPEFWIKREKRYRDEMVRLEKLNAAQDNAEAAE